MKEEAIPGLRRLTDAGAGGSGDPLYPQWTPAPARRQLAASFQLNVEKGVGFFCPHCGEPGEDAGLTLGLTIGPSLDGMQVLLVRPGASLESVLDDVRRTMIRDALKSSHGKQSAAAMLLGMKYTTFHALARRLGFGRKGSSQTA